MKKKLFYVLLYCKCYPTFDLLSVLFNFDCSCTHYWVNRLLWVLEITLGERQVLPMHKLRNMAEFTQRFPDVKEVIVDVTERAVHHPQNRECQKEYTQAGKIDIHTSRLQSVEGRSE